LISAKLISNEYSVELEGKQGTTGVFWVYISDQEADSLEGGKIIGLKGKILSAEVTFDSAPAPYSSKTLVFHLK
jgi:predicted RNA-binding protein YlqC (UPF0109 family)